MGGSASGDIAVVRYDEDGSLDSSFSGDGRATAGFTTHRRRGSRRRHPARREDRRRWRNVRRLRAGQVRPDGSLDATFGGDGVVTTDFGEGLPRRMSCSSRPAPRGRLCQRRLRPGALRARRRPGRWVSGDGMLTTEMTTYDAATQHRLKPDGRIVVGGSANTPTASGPLTASGPWLGICRATALRTPMPMACSTQGPLSAGLRSGKERRLPRFRRNVSLYLYGAENRAFSGEVRRAALRDPALGFQDQAWRPKGRVASGTAYTTRTTAANYSIPTKRTRGAITRR